MGKSNRLANPLPWHRFVGSPAALKWNRRDLANLDATLRFVKGRTLAVQAGGNLGIFPKVLAHEFSTVYTFEPDPLNYALLRQNAREKNIRAYQCALGSASTVCTLSRVRRGDKGTPPHEGLVHVEAVGAGETPMVTLDSLELEVVDLLYLDIEGYELEALRGAVDVLDRCRPIVVVEINKAITFTGHTADDVRGYLTEHGYAFKARLVSDELFLPLPTAVAS